MKPSKHFPIVLLMAAGLLFSFQPAVMAQKQPGAPSGDISPEKKSEVLSHLKSLQVPFISNQGQVDKDVRFYAKTLGGTLFVTDKGELVYSFSKIEGNEGESHNSPSSHKGGTKGEGDSSAGKAEQVFTIAIKEELIDAKVKEVRGDGKADTKVNYFKGNDQSKWKEGIATYESVSLGEVYEGIELGLKAYGNNVEKLFYVNPGANPADIKVKLNGAKKITVNEEGELEVLTELGPVKFTKPMAYQEKPHTLSPHQGEGSGEGKKQLIEVAYVVNGESYGFKVGDYDKTRQLTIDPLLASTFIGGYTGESAYAIALDTAGNVYVTGATLSSDYPTTELSYDSSYNGGYEDVFVSKLDPNLSSLLASTFIGGGLYEGAFAIALDATGNVYVTGQTSSSGYPTAGTPFDSSHNGGYDDVFVSKLDTNLSSLLASTFIGGGLQEIAKAMALDATGNVYVAGYGGAGYPTAGTPYDSSNNGGSDVFISKLDPNSQASLPLHSSGEMQMIRPMPLFSMQQEIFM